MKILEYRFKDKVKGLFTRAINLEEEKQKKRMERERQLSRIMNTFNIEAQRAFSNYTMHLESRLHEILRNELK